MKKEVFSAEYYQRLKALEQERVNRNKNEETKRGLKFALIWLIMSGVFAIIILSVSLSIILVG